MFGLIKKMFIELFTSIVSVSNLTKFISLNNQNARLNVLLSIYILMSALKGYVTTLCY